MFYKKFPPHNALSFYVECYYVWEAEAQSEKPLQVESPPNAFTSIIFNYADDYYVSSINKDKQVIPRQFIVGQQTASYTLYLPGKIGMAGIVFKPTGIASLFKVDMFALTKERVDLGVFLPAATIQSTMDSINACETPIEKAKALEQFVFCFYNQHRPEPDVIDRAANLIVEKKGNININELCRQIFVSRRQFERKFLRKVGVSPKYYSRLRRISYLCYKMAGKKEINWQKLYNSADFYDQSHFIKDFIEFTGRSPAEYFGTNIELVHHMKPKD